MDDYGLRNKVALIAGGGSRDDGIGNGRGAAILLARSGAKVAVMDQNLEAAETTVAMIRDEGNTAAAFACDFRCRGAEHLDEPVSDSSTLLLGIVDPLQVGQELL